ncbi:MAG: UxaA family hydrolase, partial [Kiritimatiellae bacterium]|nr:UxaA family hydrolase [Kiritimatiellia bacterium]
MIIHPNDNVEIREDGHKYALRDLKSGENVIKYGMPIGHAICDIAKGEHVHTHNVATNLGDLLEYTYEPEFTPVEKVDDARTFMGYRRADGQVGIRNDIWVIPTVGCVNNLCRRLAATCGGIALEHPYGCSQLGDDHETTANLLAA